MNATATTFTPQRIVFDKNGSLRNRGRRTFQRIGAQPGIGATTNRRNPTRRHFIGGVVFIIFNLLIFAYWAAFPLLNTQFFHGYGALGTTSAEFRSARYGWDWWTIWLLTLNGLCPFLLAMALTENRVQEFSKAHGFVSSLLILVNIWCFAVLSIRGCAYCNREGTPGSTACNSDLYCGVYYGASENQQWCLNNVPFNPPVTASRLKKNSQYFQHWLFSIFFFILSFWNLGILKELTGYGIFSSEDPSYDGGEEE